MPSFSVVIPFRNRVDYLPTCLHSVTAQTVRPLQIVLVDNGSTDDSANACQTLIDVLRAKGSDIAFNLITEPRRGAALARNRGLELATGEWVAFFDSDDKMSPDFLSDVASIITTNEEAEVIAAATRMTFGNGYEKVRKVYYTTSITDQLLCGMLSTQGMVFRRSFIEHIGGWNSRLFYWDDWELGVRVLLCHPRLVWIRNKAYHHILQHEDSITGRLAMRTREMTDTLNTVWNLLQGIKDDHTSHIAKLAFKARLIIVLAKIRREVGNDDNLITNLFNLVNHYESTTSTERRMLRLLYIYVLHGGRGGWLLYRFWLKRYKK